MEPLLKEDSCDEEHYAVTQIHLCVCTVCVLVKELLKCRFSDVKWNLVKLNIRAQQVKLL